MTQSSTHSPTRPLPKGQQNLSFLLSVLSVGLVILFLCAGLFVEQGFSESEAISIFAGVMLLVASVMTVVFKKLRRKEEALTVDYLNLGIQRYVLGLFMVKYGVPKLFWSLLRLPALGSRYAHGVRERLRIGVVFLWSQSMA